MSQGARKNVSWHTHEMSHGTLRKEAEPLAPQCPEVLLSEKRIKSWHTYEWVMAHTWMSHGTHVKEPCHTYEWIMSHLWVSHGTHVNESQHTCKWAMSHVWMNHVTHRNKSWHTHGESWHTHGESWHTYETVMAHIWHASLKCQVLCLFRFRNVAACSKEWRRCIGCLNLQVSFRKRAVNDRAFLRKVS